MCHQRQFPPELHWVCLILFRAADFFKFRVFFVFLPFGAVVVSSLYSFLRLFKNFSFHTLGLTKAYVHVLTLSIFAYYSIDYVIFNNECLFCNLYCVVFVCVCD